ncbi:hypothetical protein C8Q79DRAFT_909390 [Trametes meyenii]|nr:hypothetical protein C8Q79DRAFT_909390 [Trametes meyenii]
MSTLGKRKERDGQHEGHDGAEKQHGSTLFVSNLPYTATSTDLKTLFSDIAPVRTAFVVLDQGTGVSKGVGYVSFAIREDAAMAIDQISKEGITLDGRSLRAQWAGSKNKDHEHGEEPKKLAAQSVVTPRPAKSSGPSDPLAIRTVVIAGLPADVDSKTLWKKVRKLHGAEKVEWPVKADSAEDDHSMAHALFETPALANEAVNKLHAHVFKGALLSATLKKRLDGLAKPAKKAKPSAKSSRPKASAAPNRNSRLIVRNLPFDITEQDLRAIFLPHGPIHSVHIPLGAEETKKEDHNDDVKQEGGPSKSRGRSKGFAFVWFLSRKDAEKAMEKCNGMTVEAGMAETLVLDKQKRKKQRREERKRKVEAGADAEEAEGDEDEDEQGRGRQRVIAVDWALSKDKWEAEKAKLEAEREEDEDVEMDEGGEDARSDQSDESDEDREESGSEDEKLGVHEDVSDESDSGESHDGSDDDVSDEEKPAKPTLPAPEVGTTLFIRNVPFEATEDELRTLFRAFGPLRYARITLDAATGRSRGTGFACFWNKEDADKAIEQSEILRAETVGSAPAVTKKNPFKMPSLLTPDPSASIAQNLVLHGRTLDVSRAVTRDEATRLKEIGERQREKADKRNLYLLREGIILPNTPAAELLPSTEVEKRTQSFNARRALLRSNPSLFVSRTRLSVRQLPLFVTERMLKRLAIHATRAFETEVKESKREPLTVDELTEPTPADADNEHDGRTDDADSEKSKGHKVKGKGGKTGRPTGVIQAKIVRQQDRVDPVTGKGRSRGYGFVELARHADALRVLRWANNNLAVGRLFEEWWRAELEDLIKAEKTKGQDKRDEQRIKRIREELEKGVPPKSKGTLIVEFSIENIQVVQRRAALQKGPHAGEGARGVKSARGKKDERSAKATRDEKPRSLRRRSLPSVKDEEADEQPPKKKRRGSDPPKPSSISSPVSAGNEGKGGTKVGSLIGRKRKERKMKKARGK